VRKRAAIGNDIASISVTGPGNIASQRRIDSSVTRTVGIAYAILYARGSRAERCCYAQYEDRAR
jgi:hypothetical protein